MKGGNEKKIIIGYSVLHLGPSPLSFRSDINRCCQDHSSTRRWGQRHPQLQGEPNVECGTKKNLHCKGLGLLTLTLALALALDLALAEVF